MMSWITSCEKPIAGSFFFVIHNVSVHRFLPSLIFRRCVGRGMVHSDMRVKEREREFSVSLSLAVPLTYATTPGSVFSR